MIRSASAIAPLLLALVVVAAPLRAQEVTELGLVETVRTALEANRDLAAARAALETAEEQVSEAWSNVYPSIELNASYSRNVSPTVSFLPAQIFDPTAPADQYIGVKFGADNAWNSTLSLEQPLLRPGAFVAVGAAGRFARLQEEVYRGRAHSVVTDVRIGYYQLLLAQEQARLTENSVRRVRESLAETQAMFEAGLASEYDVLRLEVELANLEPNLRRAANAVLQARRELAVRLGLQDQEGLRVRGSLAEMDLEEVAANTPANREILEFAGIGSLDEGADEALRAAAELRSDLRQLEFTEDLRHTEMRLEQVEYLPDITLFGDYIINAQDDGRPNFFARGDGQRAYSRIVGIRVSLPIFQGFRRDARIDQKRAQLRAAQAFTQQGRDRVVSEVRGLVDATSEALDRARGQRAAVGFATRGFEIATAQYREGLGSQLELTDAEVALRQSEFNYAQAVFDYLVARARLDVATGRVPLVDR